MKYFILIPGMEQQPTEVEMKGASFLFLLLNSHLALAFVPTLPASSLCLSFPLLWDQPMGSLCPASAVWSVGSWSRFRLRCCRRQRSLSCDDCTPLWKGSECASLKRKKNYSFLQPEVLFHWDFSSLVEFFSVKDLIFGSLDFSTS